MASDTERVEAAARSISEVSMRAAAQYLRQREIPYTAERGEAICARMRALFGARLDGMMAEATAALEARMPEAAVATLLASARLVGIQSAIEVTA